MVDVSTTCRHCGMQNMAYSFSTKDYTENHAHCLQCRIFTTHCVLLLVEILGRGLKMYISVEDTKILSQTRKIRVIRSPFLYNFNVLCGQLCFLFPSYIRQRIGISQSQSIYQFQEQLLLTVFWHRGRLFSSPHCRI